MHAGEAMALQQQLADARLAEEKARAPSTLNPNFYTLNTSPKP